MTQQTLVRQFSKELDEEERRELSAVLAVLRSDLKPGNAQDRCDQLDLEELGIRVHVHSRGDQYQYTVSEVLVPDREEHIKKGHILLKAGSSSVTSFSPSHLRQFCRTQLTNSCVRLIFGSKDAGDDSNGVDFIAVKVGFDAMEKSEVGYNVGSAVSGCLPCCQSLLLGYTSRRCVVTLGSSHYYLEPRHDRTLRKSQKSYVFEERRGFLAENNSKFMVTTLETCINDQRYALCYKNPNQSDRLSLRLERPPIDAGWPFENKDGQEMINRLACTYLFSMVQRKGTNRFELRPLHYKDFALCLDEDDVVVRRRDKDLQGSSDIFDFLKAPEHPNNEAEGDFTLRSREDPRAMENHLVRGNETLASGSSLGGNYSLLNPISAIAGVPNRSVLWSAGGVDVRVSRSTTNLHPGFPPPDTLSPSLHSRPRSSNF